VGNKENIVNVSEQLIQGVRYEHLFVAGALSKRLIPEQPVVPVPWDYSVCRLDNLQNIRVQIKGTGKMTRDKRYQITAKTGSDKTVSIDPKVVDILSCYVEDYDIWYNIPTLSLAGKSVWLYPHNRESTGQYECWKHNWSVFKT